MKNRDIVGLLSFVFIGTSLLLNGNVVAADKVVIVPLGGTVGNATAADVAKDKTFSSKAAGKGMTGTLQVRDGSIIYTNSVGMEFSLIPAGSFVMGSPDGTGDATHRPVWPAEPGHSPLGTQHIVTLTSSFYTHTTEVTQGQWETVMGSGTNPSHFNTCGSDCPVENVSLNDVQNFIDALNAKEGRGNCNTTPNTCYSLPTESQWEYAARAGTVTAFYSGAITDPTGNDPNMNRIGWYQQNSDSTTHPVAQKDPNNWGLYDMSGNVQEWCQDLFGTYPDGPVEDPTGVPSGVGHVIRNGSFAHSAVTSTSASRSGPYSPDYASNFVGFRLVMPPDQ